ncbi:LpqN/LpqT family lipoprotein [Mycolicibacterium sp. XJ870]
MAASRIAALLVLATLLTTSCTRVVEDARAVPGPDLLQAAAADNPDCEDVDAPLTTIASRDAAEPVLKIPQPDGWERTTMMDSELIRFAMGNPGLGTPDFTPVAVVTLETVPGRQDAEMVFANQRDALESGLGATGVEVTPHTLCGLPAETVHYQMPVMGIVGPHPAMVVAAVMHVDDSTYIAAVTIQSTTPDNQQYQRDSELILTGFQMLPPEQG